MWSYTSHKLAIQLLHLTLFCCFFQTHFTKGSSTISTSKLSVLPVATISGTTVHNSTNKSTNATSVPPTTPMTTASSTWSSVHLIVTPTTPPRPATTTKSVKNKDNGRKFDGLSFFGGIILGAAITIILLFSVKYYQAKKRSYHSL